MAKLPALVSALAEVDGRDRPTIDHIARTIREAGYIPTGKRGVGASEMDARAAANMLIALASTETIREIPTEIDRFRSLKLWHAGGFDGASLNENARASLPAPLADVLEATTFGEAMEILVEGVPELLGAFLSYAGTAYPDRNLKTLWQLLGMEQFGLTIEFRQYLVTVEMFTMHGSKRRSEINAVFAADDDRLSQGFYGRRPSNRRVAVTFNFKVLMTAWNALFPEKEIVGPTDGGPS